jgi:hypothetical protein
MIDTATYNAYLRKDWKTVLNMGRTGINNDIDYYYLRMRMGIAAFEKKNYRRAIPHFKKARMFNENGASLYDYLYHAYFQAGRLADARILYANLTPSERQKNNLYRQNKVFGNAYFQYFKNSNTIRSDNFSRPADPLLNGTQIALNQMFQSFGDLDIEAGRRVNLYLAYTYIFQNRFYYQQESGISTIINEHRLHQNQVYLASNIFLGSGWNVLTAYHYATGYTPNYYSRTMGPGTGGILVLPSWRFHDHLLHLALSKELSYFTFGMEANVARIQESRYFQGGISLAAYPLGNLNFYSTNNIYYLSEFEPAVRKSPGLVFESTLGWKMASFLWFELYGSWGDHRHVSVASGRVIYNGPNHITEQYGASIIIPFARYSARFVLNYYYVGSESYFDTGGIDYSINNISIKSHSIRGGLTWTF